MKQIGQNLLLKMLLVWLSKGWYQLQVIPCVVELCVSKADLLVFLYEVKALVWCCGLLAT